MINCPYCSSLIPDSSSKCPICGGDIEADASLCTPLEEGSVIYSKYKIEKVIGQGGFGITYIAYDEKLDRKVAIKEYFPDGIATRSGNKVTIPPTLDNNENLQSFKNEARSIAKLKNQGIVDVYDVIEENDTVYIVMEYIEGVTLSSLLGKIGEKDSVKYIKQIAEAIGAVHAAGLLHQDIKPDNIIIGDSGDIKIIDFGSSRTFAADKTKTYEKILTPGYAPLEQYGGKGKRGEYTDVYAICATLYAFVKGVPPPESTDLAGGMDIDFTGISEDLKSILEKGLSVKIPERIQNTAELIKLLDGFEKRDPALNRQTKIAGQSPQNLPGFQLGPEAEPEKIDEPATALFDSHNKLELYQNNDHKTERYRPMPMSSEPEAYLQIKTKNFRKATVLIITITAVIISIAFLVIEGYHYYMLSNKKLTNGNNSTTAKTLSGKLKAEEHETKTGKLKHKGSVNSASTMPPANANSAGGKQVALHKPYEAPKPAYAKPYLNKRAVLQISPHVFNGAGYQDFSASGCFYCHRIYGKGKQNGYNLSHIGSSLSYSQIKNYIVHPGSSMPPNPNMPPGEVSQISGWLENLK